MGLLKTTIAKLDRPAILIGNGINLCSNLFPCWSELLKKYLHIDFKSTGLTNTEVYDFIEMQRKEPDKLKFDIATSFKYDLTKDFTIHKSFINLTIQKDCPVLTTNFDLTFEQILLNSKNAYRKFYRTSKDGFTRFYPWDTYFGNRQHNFPTDGFGIWHIHGMTNYHDSIRLGLTDYMGSVEKARKLIHNGEDRLFNGKNENNWNGQKTWLHIWFNSPIIIVGLKLATDEVFIRWLCIEREKYFRKFPNRRKKTYYLSKGDNIDLENFLENLKITSLKANDYSSLYF